MSGKRKQGASSSGKWFRSDKKKEAYTSLVTRDVIPERYFVLPLSGSPQFARVIQERGWQTLAGKQKLGCEDVVREFYANARVDDALGEFEEPIYTSWYRGTKVDYSPQVIHKLLKLPTPDPFQGKKLSYHELLEQPPLALILESIAIHGVIWEPDSAGPNRYILRNHLKHDSKVWSQFVLDTVIPSSHQADLRLNESLFLHCIVQNCPIDVARLISDRIHEVAQSNTKPRLPFPNLITRLVEKSGVRIAIKNQVKQCIDLTDGKISRMIKKAGECHDEFREELRTKELARQQKEAANASPGQIMQFDPKEIFGAIGAVLRRVDAVHRNMERDWKSKETPYAGFEYPLPHGSLEKMLMQMSLDVGPPHTDVAGADTDDDDPFGSD